MSAKELAVQAAPPIIASVWPGDRGDPRRDAFRFGIGGFWRLSQQEGCDLLDGLRERESFAGSVVEFGGYPVEVDGVVD